MNVTSLDKPEEEFYINSLFLSIILRVLITLTLYLDHTKHYS